MAPLTPFITERVWQDLVCSVDADAAASVHLSTWPTYDAALIDDELEQRDGADPPAGRAGPGRARRGEGQDPAAVEPRADPLGGATPTWATTCWPRSPPSSTSRPSSRSRRPATSSTTPPRATSATSASGSASRRPQVAAVIAAADAARLAAELADRRDGDGGLRRQSGRADRRRRDHLRASARGLVGRQRARRDRCPRPAPDAGAGTGRAGPRGRPHRPGGAQGQRPRRVGPDHRDLVRPTASSPTRIREHAELVADEVLAVQLAESDAGPDWQRDADLGLAFTLTKS